MMRTLLLRLSFVGTAYHGFQIQQNALTVQQVFQDALYRMMPHRPDIKGCSRTDTGVHALAFCISFSTDSDMPTQHLVRGLNAFLPRDIRVTDARDVQEGFHARYDAVKKRYKYLVWNAASENPFLIDRAHWFRKRMDEGELTAAGQRFVGKKDFRPFSGSKRKSSDTIREVTLCSVHRRDDLVIFSVEADGFLYNMVRILVGTLLAVADGKLQAEEIEGIFQTGIRPACCITAPAHGLYLERVYYGIEGES